MDGGDESCKKMKDENLGEKTFKGERNKGVSFIKIRVKGLKIAIFWG